MNKYDLTLRQLNHDKPLQKYYETHETKEMIDCIHLYNDKILDDYLPYDIMKMVKQNICNEEMVPLALDIIRHNEMIKVDKYAGDMLTALVSVDKDYWTTHQSQKKEVELILTRVKDVIDRCVAVWDG